MIDYHEALREMNKGNVVKYVGTVNGNVWSDNGGSFCMCRGCIFLFDRGEIKWNKLGYMVYDPDFRYELTGETVDPRAWKPEKNKDRKEIKSKLGYSRVGLGNTGDTVKKGRTEMKLYIRNHPDEITQPWWDRFEATLVPRYVGTDALEKHIEDRRAKLDAHGAVMHWDKDTGVPYLKFDNEKNMVWFMLKWS